MHKKAVIALSVMISLAVLFCCIYFADRIIVDKKQPNISEEAEFSGGDKGDDTPLEWPAEQMGDVLPVPICTITSIDHANQVWGAEASQDTIVVSFKDMKADDAKMYYNKLKKLEFKDGNDIRNSEKIEFSGSIDEAGIAISFTYSFAEGNGFIAYNPEYGSEFASWPEDKMGNIPDPGCIIVWEDSNTSDGFVTVEFAEMNEDNAVEYAARLRQLGYVSDIDTLDDVEIKFRGYDDDGRGVVFYYSIVYRNGMILYGTKENFSKPESQTVFKDLGF